jgi:hypothetical protein
MRLTTILAVVAALTVAATAAATSGVNGTDRANAARACSALRTSLGATTFGHQYATFGACTSQWVARAHAARMAALTACQAKNLSGKALSNCVKGATNTTLATQVTTYKNAAKACAAELKSLGVTAFEHKYGTNTNLRNAFGKCVSKQVSSKGTGGQGGGGAAQHFAVSLGALNNSGVSGSGTLLLNKNVLTVKLTIDGLEANQQHAVAIRGLASGNATCPTSAADTNADSTITLTEGQPFFGAELLALDSAAQSGSPQTVSSTLSPLQTRTIVVLGKTVNGTYDATLPVACGVIASK